jgi:amino acid transporter
MIGPFAELTSSFPVAGGMATWAWQCARHGIGGERYWGWLVGGFTLAMHLGKIISYLYGVTASLTIIYYSGDPSVPKIEVEGVGLVPVDPKSWWEPVFYLALIGVVAILCLTRVSRKGTFWIVAAGFNIAVMVLVYVLIIASGAKIRWELIRVA